MQSAYHRIFYPAYLMNLSDNIHHIQQTIRLLAKEYHRPSDSVTLIAVSKGQSITAIEHAFIAGIRQFGENYWQEAKAKMQALAHLPIDWHFIGPIQSNKTADIAQQFTWVHSVDRLKVASQLSRHRPSNQPPLKVCIQVNLDSEPNKRGVETLHLPQLIKHVNELPSIQLKGLMAIPKPQMNPEDQYQSFLRLSLLLQEMNQQFNLTLDTLSMGMSDDLGAAIRAGSTMIRIGRAIFGERQTS